MADFKSMYYHLAGRTATAVDVLEATTSIMEANAKAMESNAKALVVSAEAMMSTAESLTKLKEKLKLSRQITEDMFIDDDDKGLNGKSAP